jgi:hypothetical protein
MAPHRRPSRIFQVASLLLLLPSAGISQQVIQRGPFGKPAQVFDETQQWTIPLLVSSARNLEIYIPDVTSSAWLSRNYSDFINHGTYTLSTFTLYKSVEACRSNQIRWGMSDNAHLDACNDIKYRARQIVVDPNQKSVQLVSAAMIDEEGQIVPESVQDSSTFRTWDQLDPATQQAILKTNELVTRQMKIYDAKVHNDRTSPRRTH